MTDHTDLKCGDRVVYRDDMGTLHTATVQREPWQLGHGTWVIGLTGRSGGYALDRVAEKLPSLPSPRCRMAVDDPDYLAYPCGVADCPAHGKDGTGEV